MNENINDMDEILDETIDDVGFDVISNEAKQQTNTVIERVVDSGMAERVDRIDNLLTNLIGNLNQSKTNSKQDQLIQSLAQFLPPETTSIILQLMDDKTNMTRNDIKTLTDGVELLRNELRHTQKRVENTEFSINQSDINQKFVNSLKGSFEKVMSYVPVSLVDGAIDLYYSQYSCNSKFKAAVDAIYNDTTLTAAQKNVRNADLLRNLVYKHTAKLDNTNPMRKAIDKYSTKQIQTKVDASAKKLDAQVKNSIENSDGNTSKNELSRDELRAKLQAKFRRF